MKSRDQIRRLLRDYQRSGLTQRQFAAQNGLPISTFTHWLRRARAGDFDRPQAQWIEARLPAAPEPATDPGRFLLEFGPDLRLHLPGDVQPDLIVQLLRQLRSSCSR